GTTFSSNAATNVPLPCPGINRFTLVCKLNIQEGTCPWTNLAQLVYKFPKLVRFRAESRLCTGTDATFTWYRASDSWAVDDESIDSLRRNGLADLLANCRQGGIIQRTSGAAQVNVYSTVCRITGGSASFTLL